MCLLSKRNWPSLCWLKKKNTFIGLGLEKFSYIFITLKESYTNKNSENKLLLLYRLSSNEN